MRVRSIGFALLLVAAGAAPAQAQPGPRGSLRLTVADATGAVIVGAHVHLFTDGIPSETMSTDERGEALFSELRPGRYDVRVESDGFETTTVPNLRVRQGETRREIRLAIARVLEDITVGRDPREAGTDPRGDAFATVLTPEQIAALPDDPEEFEEALRQMAGPGAVMRVNGFRGGQLPPKSQIREIRFRRNFYAADSHEPGFIAVDIITRPGSSSWRGSVDFGFRDGALNARNALAPARPDEQQHRYGFSLDGPLVKDRTSIAFATDGLRASDSMTIRAATPDGRLSDLLRRPTDRLNFSSRLEHALTGSHTLRAELQRAGTTVDNLGVGTFDLPERAFSRDVRQHVVRLSESGPIGRQLYSEIRFQTSWNETTLTSQSQEPTVQVLNAFTAGGAQVSGSRRSREFELANNVDFATRRHALRFGFLLEGGRYRSDESRNTSGTFVFPSLDAFAAGTPATYTRREGHPLVEYSTYQLGWYAQDDIRVRRDLTLSVGLRHELQGHLADRLNLAPRGGFAWSPFSDGRTTVRGGAGIFFDWFDAATYEQTLRVDGTRQRDLIVTSPGFPDPLDGGTAIPLAPSRLLQDPAMQMPTGFTTSVGVERQVAGMTRLNVSYFHGRGWHQLRGRNANAPGPDGVRPDPSWGNVTIAESTARSESHRLTANLSVVVPSRQLFLATTYTLAHEINESDGPFSLPAASFDMQAERGPAPNDVRHRVMGMFNLGLGKGFRMASTFRAASASPYNVTTGFDDNRDGIVNDRPAGVTRNRARGSGHFELGARLSWARGFGRREEGGGVPVVRIVRPAEGGDVPGNMGGIGRDSSRVRLELYVAASNLTNRANPQGYSGVMTSPFFGQPTAAGPARKVELGTRITF